MKQAMTIKRIGSFLLSIVFLCSVLQVTSITPSATGGTTYYVSNRFGNDLNNGLSPNTALKSFAFLRTVELTAGDRILLRRGDTWNERLSLYAPNGTSDNWIYIGPYGYADESMPTISLTNSRDDIGIVAQDLAPWAPYNLGGMNYLHIDNIRISNARIGIYFRYVVSTQNKGIKVTNCEFNNMIQDSVMENMNLSSEAVAQELNTAKGNLDKFEGTYSTTGGGVAEYVWPSAITIGGKSPSVNSSSNEVTSNIISEIEVSNTIMNNCVDGVNAIFYNCQTPGNAFKGLIQNIRMSNVTLTGSVNGVFAIDGANGGYDGTSGTNSNWGVFKNVISLNGHPTYSHINGTTAAILNNSKNFYITDCEFSGQTNNSRPDGCGFDFESNNNDIWLINSIFNSNKGQAVLIMDGGSFGSHQNLYLKNNLYYNNLQGVTGSAYKYDICIWNDGNQNIQIKDSRFVSKLKTAGTNSNYISSYGPKTSGVSESNNSTRRWNTLTDYQTEVNNRGLTNAQTATTISQITNAQDIVIPVGLNQDLFIQNGSFTMNDNIISGNGALAWVPSGCSAIPKNMPSLIDISYDMYVADSDEHSGIYIGCQSAASSYGDENGFLYYANKWGVFVYAGTRGQLGVIPRANLSSYNVNAFNQFRIIKALDGTGYFYVNGNLVMTISNAAPPQANGGYLGFNTTNGTDYMGYFKNIQALIQTS